jgi:excisionase family DNA binding protein
VAGDSGTQGSVEVEPRFFTLDETARYLNVSHPQVYALVRSGELPAIKIGGRGVWRVDRRQLDEYIERLLKETREWAKAHPLSPDRNEAAEEALRET